MEHIEDAFEGNSDQFSSVLVLLLYLSHVKVCEEVCRLGYWYDLLLARCLGARREEEQEKLNFNILLLMGKQNYFLSVPRKELLKRWVFLAGQTPAEYRASRIPANESTLNTRGRN